MFQTIQTRGAAVIQARKMSSAMSAAKAAVDHMRDWWNGTPNGTWVSMGVISNGSYGVPKDLIYSFPVSISNKQWKIVEVQLFLISNNDFDFITTYFQILQDLEITDFAKSKLELTAKELLAEKEEAMAICNA